MRLNYDKCYCLAQNIAPKTVFADGKRMQIAEDVEYLGSCISPIGQADVEVQRRIAKAWASYWQLKFFFRQTDTSRKWKLRVISAIMHIKILYGLNTTVLYSQNLKKWMPSKTGSAG